MRAQSPATTVSMGTTETELYTGAFISASWVYVYVTDAGSNAYVLYPQYSSDGTTWYKDIDYQPSLAAAAEGYLGFLGGFYIRAAGIKATGAENVSVHANIRYNPGNYKRVAVKAATTVSVGTSATAMHAGSASEEQCDAVVLMFDDNGNSNQLDVYVYLSDDRGTTFYFLRTVRIDSALNRRGAVVVWNQGQRVKVTGVKATLAENVDIEIIGRKPMKARR